MRSSRHPSFRQVPRGMTGRAAVIRRFVRSPDLTKVEMRRQVWGPDATQVWGTTNTTQSWYKGPPSTERVVNGFCVKLMGVSEEVPAMDDVKRKIALCLALLIFVGGMASRGWSQGTDRIQRIEPGALSMAQQAERALLAGDLILARESYKQWLQADPADYTGWYNYACTLSLLADTTNALVALENAVVAGWRDSTWAANDPDLKTIDEHPTFERLLTEMSAEARRERRVDSGAERFVYVPQMRLAPFSLLQPMPLQQQSKPGTLVLLLHPRGGDSESMRELAQRLALPATFYALPRAPYPVAGGRDGFEYWPRDLALSGDENRTIVGRNLTADWFRNVIEELLAGGAVDSQRVFIIGQGQGGAAALIASFLNPELVRGVGVLNGFLPESHDDSSHFAEMATHNVELFLASQTRSRAIEPPDTRRIRSFAENAGVSVSGRGYSSDEELPDEMVVELAEWIRELPPKPAAPIDVQPWEEPETSLEESVRDSVHAIDPLTD